MRGAERPSLSPAFGKQPVAERDQLEVDVLVVGAGPAGLAAAIRLRQLASQKNAELSVMVIEKGGEIGSHGISGAVLDPRALDELLPDWKNTAPLESPVTSDAMWWLTSSTAKLAMPFIPPPLRNHGKYVASLQKLTKWLGEIAEQHGADVFPSFPGQELLWEGERVAGVRIGDKGIDRDGKQKPNYEPGPDLLAKVVILSEGPRGTLAKQAVEKLELQRDRDPQVYAVGIKELWQCPEGSVKAGSVIHTLGYPNPPELFGGGFIYGMAGDVLDVGWVVGLDYKDPTTDPHDLFQRFKLHPAIRPMLDGGKLLRYGAKAIPEGGLYSMPRNYADGLLMTGDSAGFLNGMRLKGIHLAIKSGMMAAETAFDAIVAGTADAAALADVERRFRESWAYDELRLARNFHAAFKGGLLSGMMNAGVSTVLGGRGFGISDHLRNEPGYAQMKKLSERPPREREKRVKADNVITFDKVTDVFNSGTMHDENQPAHLHVSDTDICANRCTVEYGNPCQYFCPAAVYEPLFQRQPDGAVEGRLQLNFTNCVHCKTCDIMDPYQIITWVPPQGGEGPVYTGM
ncbi:MAG: electron transfer flavoprotein-ubiquinone oxidoreductase [Candidatus Eremiobacteraeota bacterium]|nr:electron transfer flavoprotein-ubiquinone oxidoreductase [Candidatus Eremiobacteraeota bacterium]MBV9647791.1 electron transfer flavoprotein-ubiquinone oxidoreductase [Candidatus Eremiobacteraeota bacterium]